MPLRKREVVVKNKAQCRLCKDTIESYFRNDLKSCRCGEIFIDGGKDYIRRAARDFNNLIDLSETYEEEYESSW